MRRRKPSDDEGRCPLWGDHWNLGSFWDALLVVRAKIRTASAALTESGPDYVGLVLDDVAGELKRLADRAHEELSGGRIPRRKGGGDGG